MSYWLFRKRWYLILSAVGFAIAFIVSGRFYSGIGNNEIPGNAVYQLLFYLWASLISIYLFWLTVTLHGKSKNDSKTKKLIKLAFPTLFVIFATFISSMATNAILVNK